MRGCRRELVTSDESTIPPKPLLDAIVMEDRESDGRLANSTCANESDGGQIFCKANDLLDRLVASKTGPGWRRR